MKYTLLTHYDLDGVGCAILFEEVLGEKLAWIETTSYNNIDMKINKLRYQKEAPKNLIITDLALTVEQADFIDTWAQSVIYIDHHKDETHNKSGIVYPGRWTVIKDTEHSGTKLTYNFISKKHFDKIKKYEKFVEYVNDYDLWIHNYYESRIYNHWFWKEHFWNFKKAIQNSIELPEEIYNDFKEKENKIIEYVNNGSYINIEDRIAVIHKTDVGMYELSLYLKEPRTLVFIEDNKISVRSDYDLTNYFQYLNEHPDMYTSVGGHENSGGAVCINQDAIIDAIGLLDEYISTLIKEKN